MTLSTLPSVQPGRSTCTLGTARFKCAPSPSRSFFGGLVPRQTTCARLLLPSLPGRKVGVLVLASSQQESEPHKGSSPLLASLRQWCHRLTGALVLVPFLVFGGSRHAVAHPVNQSNMSGYPAASIRPNPLFESSSVDVRQSTQVRAAATLAAAMVGYGFVRNGTGGGLVSEGASRSVSRNAVATVAAETAVADEPPPPLPLTPRERTERLGEIYLKIEDLKSRNAEIWALAQKLMEEDASLSVCAATVMAAESLDLADPQGAAAAAMVANAATAELLLAPQSPPPAAAAAAPTPPPRANSALPIRPSGGAARGTPTASVSMDDVSAAAAASIADVVADAAAAAGVPMRPSGGASRLASPLSSVDSAPFQSDKRVPPERSGGASSRTVRPVGLSPPGSPEAAAALKPRSPPDSSRVRATDDDPSTPTSSSPSASSLVEPTPNLAAWAGEVLQQTANGSPGVNGNGNGVAKGLNGNGKTNGRVRELSKQFDQIIDNPIASDPLASPPSPAAKESSSPTAAEPFRPAMRPTRRASGAGAKQPRTFRAIAAPPPRSNPSFDIPENAPSPSEYLKDYDGRMADGQVNPSFAPVRPAPASSAPPPAVSPPEAQQHVSATTAAASIAADVDTLGAQQAEQQLQEATAAVAAAAAVVVVPEVEAPTSVPEVEEAEEVLPTPVAPQAVEASAPPPPPQPEPQVSWFNPLAWFSHRSDDDGSERAQARNPSFDASLAVTSNVEEVEGVPPTVASAVAPPVVEAVAPPPHVLEPAESLVESLVRVAEEKAAEGDAPAGVGAAAAASAAAWSDALTEGAKPGDFSPVERVAELLEVAMKTEEYKYAKYDPLRNALADVSAPTGAHKYDMLRGLLRAGRDKPEAADVVEEATAAPRAHKYDLVYDLLQSLRTSGDPAVILPSSDPKYDPVWCLLNMNAPTPGSLSKYDLVGSMIKAALAASPQPSRYDPMQPLLQMKPVTGSFKYCLAEVLLRGGWQRALKSGLSDLPSWDPMAAVVGADAATSRAAAAGRRRTVSKYDMVGQALQAAASLPDELASGKWAAAQPRDLVLKPRARTEAPRLRRPRSKYDMVGQALDAVATLPTDLATGKWAAGQGRELLVDTVKKTMNEGGWGFVRRLRQGGSAAFKAVSAATAPVGNLLAKAVGLPYEVAPGVLMKLERPRGASPGRAAVAATAAGPVAVVAAAVAGIVPAVTAGSHLGGTTALDGAAASPTSASTGSPKEDDELPSVVFQFKNAAGPPGKAPGRKSSETTARGRGSGSAGPVTVTAKRRSRSSVPASRLVTPELQSSSSSAAAEQPSATVPVAAADPAAAAPALAVQRLERANVPPSRVTARRVAVAAAAASSVQQAALPYIDPEALVAALTDSDVEASTDSADGVKGNSEAMAAATATVAAAPVAEAAAEPVAPAVEATAAVEESIPAVPASAKEEQVAAHPVEAPATAASAGPLKLSELAVDLLVVMSVKGARGSAPATLEELTERFGNGFGEIAVQLRSLRGNGPLMARHPAIARLVRTASSAHGDGTHMWSNLYDMLGSVKDAEQAMPAFLDDSRSQYPLVYGLLTTGDVGQGVSVLCTLCNLVPGGSIAGGVPKAAAAQ